MDRNQIGKWLKSPGKMAHKHSLHVVYFCTGCGIIEIPPVITARWDAERFGVIPVAAPRHANLFLITGYVSVKTLKAIIRTYEQMPDPKYTVGFGSCPINGGMYWDSYNTIKHLDKYIPVDGWIAGCMPRPEAVFIAVTHLWTLIDKDMADGYLRYRKNYASYRRNQEMLLGELGWAPLYQESGGRDQESGGRDQESGGRDQESGGRDQESGGRDQESGGRDQESGGRDQESGGRDQESGGRDQESGGRDQESGGRDQESGGRDQESGGRDQESGGRDQESGGRDQESGIRDQESGVGK